MRAWWPESLGGSLHFKVLMGLLGFCFNFLVVLGMTCHDSSFRITCVCIARRYLRVYTRDFGGVVLGGKDTLLSGR